MKITVIDNKDPYYWHHLPDSCPANAGKPFFIPESGLEFTVSPVVAVKMSKLGKSVEAKFASRYYSEAAAGLLFECRDVRNACLEKGFAPDKAYDFDRSLILSHWVEAERLFSNPLVFCNHGELEFEDSLRDISDLTAKALEAVSRFSTVKTGDILIPEVEYHHTLTIGDRLTLYSDDELLLETAIK